MSLFAFNIAVTLKLSPAQEAQLAALASAAQREAVALEALVAKANEPPEDETALQAHVDDLARRLKESNDRLQAKTAEGPTSP